MLFSPSSVAMVSGSAVGQADTVPVNPTPIESVERARIELTAPDKGVVGELIRLDVSASNADTFKWLLVPESGDFEVYDQGRKAVFSARKTGSYMFIVACAKDGLVDVVTHVVHIVKPGDPDPTIEYPAVEQPQPDAGVAAWVTYWCAECKRPQEEALALAESFESVAAAVAGGAYTTPAEISQATGDANRAALGGSLDAWMPFLSKIRALLKQQAMEGSLTTPEQHATVWRAIAQGLLEYAAMFNPS
jgi:hypothetical protein